MKNLRTETHWLLQELADWFWDRRCLRAGNVCCRLAGFIFPVECKNDPKQWNGYAK